MNFKAGWGLAWTIENNFEVQHFDANKIKTAAILRKSCTKAERERWEIWCGFISKYWQIG